MWLGEDFILYTIFIAAHQDHHKLYLLHCVLINACSVSDTAMQILPRNGNCLRWPWKFFYVLCLLLEKKVLALALKNLRPWPWPRKLSA